MGRFSKEPGTVGRAQCRALEIRSIPMLQALPFGVGTTVLTVSTTDCIGSMMAPRMRYLVQDYRIRVVVSTPALLLCTLTGTISPASVPGTSGDMVIYI